MARRRVFRRVNDDSIRKLEEKIAYLEHHVTQQDKVMLGFAEDIARLRREIAGLMARVTNGGAGSGSAGSDEADAGGAIEERPPHY